MNRVLLGYVSLLSLLSACTSSPPLSTHKEELRSFHIPAEDAPTALNEFSRQSNKQILFDYMVLRNRQTRAVDGTLQPSAALGSMLKGTGLVARNVNDLTVAVVPQR
jgi:hypothetical protein